MNMEADHASEHFNNYTEWILDPSIFQRIVARYFKPEVGLFPSGLNHQPPLYVARYPDAGALATDAFLVFLSRWTTFNYPPVMLIPRILL